MIFTAALLLLIPCLLIAYALGRWLTGLARAFGLRWGVISHVTARSSHTQPTPRLGGAGLALAFGLASLLFLVLIGPATRLVTHQSGFMSVDVRLVAWLAAGWLLMFGVGLLDDLFDLPPLLKLGLEVLGAIVPTLAGGLIFALSGWLHLPAPLAFLLAVAISFAWILFFTNGYNFMDGMDGFAGGFACTAAALLFALVWIAAWRQDLLASIRPEAFLLPLLAMACWGFLAWNNPPARVFMGDGGSLSVGYLLTVYVILGQRGALGPRLPLASQLTILLPFIFDVTLTLIRRSRRGENLLKAHREHLYQRLLGTGLTHAAVLRLNYRLFAACGALALTGAALGRTRWRAAALALALALLLAYWRHTLTRERRTG